MLEGLTVDCRSGQALTVLDGAQVVVVDSVLMGRARVVHVDGGALELHGSRVAPTTHQSAHGSSAQLLGGALLVARDSVLSGGSLFIGQGGADVRFDRCVLDSATAHSPRASAEDGCSPASRSSSRAARASRPWTRSSSPSPSWTPPCALRARRRGGASGTRSLRAHGQRGEGAARVERLGVEPVPTTLAPIGASR